MASENCVTNFELIRIKTEFISDNDNLSENCVEKNKTVATKKIQSKKKEKIKSIFDIISKEDCAINGKVVNGGLQKIRKFLSNKKLKTWNDCEFTCKCDNKFETFKNYYLHLQINHSLNLTPNVFDCIYCPQVCRRLNSLMVHIVHRHQYLLSYCCTFCSEYFWDLNKLKMHREQHERDLKCSPVKCERCDKEYFTRENLRKHLRLVCTKHALPDTEFECDICNNKYLTKSTLREHMNKHSSKYTGFKIL